MVKYMCVGGNKNIYNDTLFSSKDFRPLEITELSASSKNNNFFGFLKNAAYKAIKCLHDVKQNRNPKLMH